MLGRHNKIPQTGWLETAQLYSLTVLKARRPKPKCLQSWFLQRPVMETLLHASLPASGCLPAIFGTCWHHPNLCLRLHMVLPRWGGVSVCVQISPSCNTSHSGLGAQPTLVRPHQNLNNYIYFKMRSHSVLGAGTSTYEFRRDKIQPII